MSEWSLHAAPHELLKWHCLGLRGRQATAAIKHGCQVGQQSKQLTSKCVPADTVTRAALNGMFSTLTMMTRSLASALPR